MPRPMVWDDDEQIIADLLKGRRRLESRVATTHVYGTHDEFTVAATPETTYQLTYIPVLGTCAMYVGGDEREEGTNYTVDYDTGIVTFVTALTTGNRINFRYLITDWLVARSLPPDTTAFADDFNRADSSTTLGSPWGTLGTGTDATNGWDTSTWGIDSNAARLQGVVTDGGGSYAAGVAYIDGMSADGQLDLDISTVTLDIFGHETIAAFRVDPAVGSPAGSRSLFLVTLTGVFWIAAGLGGSPVASFSTAFGAGDHLTIIMAGTSVSVERNGSAVGSLSSSNNLTATKHGLGGASAGSKLDNFAWESA